MSIKHRRWQAVLLPLALCVSLAACSRQPQQRSLPNTTRTPVQSASPSPSGTSGATAELGFEGEPELSVYVVSEEKLVQIDAEEYLAGVLAGEMQNDWPMEALKAQAILARTFMVKFLTENTSQYEGADISTDTAEAQAYDAAGVNERITQAVEATRGQVLTSGGTPIYAWFHSHSGGITAGAAEGLEYEGGDQPYLVSTASVESDSAPEETAEWSADFTWDELRAAAADVGVDIGSSTDFDIAATGGSGRVTRFVCGGAELPAAAFRNALGADRLRSTLITSVSASEAGVGFSGLGYGHGVGMSQWGAYQMAEDGSTAAEIIDHYYRNVETVRAWE